MPPPKCCNSATNHMGHGSLWVSTPWVTLTIDSVLFTAGLFIVITKFSVLNILRLIKFSSIQAQGQAPEVPYFDPAVQSYHLTYSDRIRQRIQI